jgi:hypothetical protein
MRTPFLMLAGTCLLIALTANPGAAQGLRPAQPPLGPEGDSVLKLPGADDSAPPSVGNPPPTANATPGAAFQNMWQNQPQQPGDGQALPQAQSSALAKLAPRDGPDPNEDILVTEKLGPWMISITSYTGDSAPNMARQLVIELRKEPYRLPAYVYNFGAEERAKEYRRVKDLIDKQRQFFRENNQPVDQPLRIRYMRVDEQCGVLIGGYANEKQARQALDNIRRLPPLDPNRVQLHTALTGTYDPANPNRVDQTGSSYVNPFLQAFLVRNPKIKVERPSDWDELDVHKLKKLNAEEPFSLFKCPRPVTLAITQFQTPTVVQPKSAAGAFLENIGLSKKSPQQIDGAALSAHSLAEVLTKNCGLKAYVLHTQYSSVVTVGEFNSVDDRELVEMQSLLSARLKLGNIPLFPTPLPMQVPH